MEDSRNAADGNVDRNEFRDSWQNDLQASARRLGAGIWAGLIPGLVIGGVGGRMAMFVLRLTSDPRLHGLETDDGFVIGKFTGDTVFLLLVGSALGAAGGVFYLIVRPWLPERTRSLAMAVLAALVGGAVVIRPDGIDFTLLEPLWLAIVMFVLLPGLYGFAMSLLAEKLLDDAAGPRLTGWASSLLPLVAILAAGPAGVVVLIIAGVGWALNRASNVTTTTWTSPGMTWVGRGGLLLIGLLALYALGKDVAEIL
jgi:hypothetical protein